MTLYKVFNGFNSYGPVHVIVIADNEERAKQLASEKFRCSEEAEYHGSSYWLELEVEVLSENTNSEYISEVCL